MFQFTRYLLQIATYIFLITFIKVCIVNNLLGIHEDEEEVLKSKVRRCKGRNSPYFKTQLLHYACYTSFCQGL